MASKIVIGGGGPCGLVAAWELIKHVPDLEITVIEKTSVLGGLSHGVVLNGELVDAIYHYLFLTDSYLVELLQELGIRDQLIWANTTTGIYLDGKIHPFSTPWDMLNFRPCGFLDRLRLALVMLYLRDIADWRKLERKTASEWMQDACGARVMDKIWAPLLKGKFDRYFSEVSMAWLWARVHSRARSRSIGGAKECLGYLTGGFCELITVLGDGLDARGVQILKDAEITKLSATERRIDTSAGPLDYDACIFTGPLSVLADLLPPESPIEGFRRSLKCVVYLGAVCLVFATEQDLGEYFWVNVHELDAPFVVFVHSTRLAGAKAGKNIYYIGSYRPADNDLFGRSSEEIKDAWFAYLRQMVPSFDSDKVVDWKVTKSRFAQHVVRKNYGSTVLPYRTPVSGLYLANFAQIYPEDRGVNFAVRQGREVAACCLEDMTCSP